MTTLRMHHFRSAGRTIRRRAAFTLTELLIAIAVLVVVILAAAKIFGTVSKVSSLGQGNADVMQEIAAIERQLRADVERMSPNGVLVIRGVAVRNDVNAPGPLLNPNLPSDAFIRSDQLMFFVDGIQSVETFITGANVGSNHKPQMTASRVYYGHAFQMPNIAPTDGSGNPVNLSPTNFLYPWSFGSASTTAGLQTVAPTFATSWILGRQAVLMGDDDATKDVYLQQAGTAPMLWTLIGNEPFPQIGIQGSRVDATATQHNDTRVLVTRNPANTDDTPWLEQRDNILRLVYYPRAERRAPSMGRADLSTTMNTLGSACSSFIVDWTYEPGTGSASYTDAAGVTTAYPGIAMPPDGEQVWFGMPIDVTNPNNPGATTFDPVRNVVPFTTWYGYPSSTPISPLYPLNFIDTSSLTLVAPGVYAYEAVFGYNHDRPLTDDGVPDVDLDYTPWPSAIRITMVLHDPDTRLINGREVQLVLDLPRRFGKR